MKKSIIVGAVSLILSSTAAFAGGGGELCVPGIGCAKGGSSGSHLKGGSQINVINNKSTGTVTAGGGEAGGYGVSAKMNSVANVNSVNLNNSTLEGGSKINVRDNTSKDVNAYGGTANVNSVNLN